MRRFLFLFFILIRSVALQAQPLYFPPIAGSNWDTLSPATLGWCQPPIDTLINYLGNRDTKAFIVLKDGKIVIEQYYGTFTADSSWYWASAGKSLTSVLIGIAQQEGTLSISDTSSKYLTQGWTVAPQAKEDLITIRNQLTMTTGLDDNVADPDCTTDTCLQYLADAGTRWAYHNAPYTLLDGVIQSATGSTLNNYVMQKLGVTTGMTGLYFPSGYNNVFLSKPRSMARFGLLMLNQGNWNGQQILDTAYFNQMVNSSQSLNPSYGYLWWLNGKSSYMLPGFQFVFPGSLCPSAPADLFSAMGKNGQILNVVPSMNLILIRMGNPPAGGSVFVPNLFNDTIWQKFNDVLCSVSSVKETEKIPAIFPNPSTGKISVRLSGEPFDIYIADIHGRYLQQFHNCTDSTVFTLQLSSGCYVAEIRTHTNKVYRNKIIIQ